MRVNISSCAPNAHTKYPLAGVRTTQARLKRHQCFRTTSKAAVIRYSVMFYSSLSWYFPFYSVLFCSIPLNPIVLCSIPFHYVMFHYVPLYDITSCSVLFHSVPFRSVPFSSILSCRILLRSIPLFMWGFYYKFTNYDFKQPLMFKNIQ